MTQAAEKEQMQIMVVDDHESVLEGTLNFLEKEYPETRFLSAKTAVEAKEKIVLYHLNLVVMDLSIPETVGDKATTDVGIELLKFLFSNYPSLNITVQSSFPKALIRIKGDIDEHQAGFTVADKSLSIKNMLKRVDWASQGLSHTRDLHLSKLELKPEWIKLLELAFDEGLQDKEIASRMCVAERTVRHYWKKVQDVLDVYPEGGKNIRIQTQKRAREEGLID